MACKPDLKKRFISFMDASIDIWDRLILVYKFPVVSVLQKIAIRTDYDLSTVRVSPIDVIGNPNEIVT